MNCSVSLSHRCLLVYEWTLCILLEVYFHATSVRILALGLTSKLLYLMIAQTWFNGNGTPCQEGISMWHSFWCLIAAYIFKRQTRYVSFMIGKSQLFCAKEMMPRWLNGRFWCHHIRKSQLFFSAQKITFSRLWVPFGDYLDPGRESIANALD